MSGRPLVLCDMKTEQVFAMQFISLLAQSQWWPHQTVAVADGGNSCVLPLSCVSSDQDTALVTQLPHSGGDGSPSI